MPPADNDSVTLGVTDPAPVSALSTVIFWTGLGLVGYFFYRGIYHAVSPKRWAPQCEECGRFGVHRRKCSRIPSPCPDCHQGAGDHGLLCPYAPRWVRAAAVAAWIGLVVLRAALRHLLL